MPINQPSLDAVRRSRAGEHFRVPLYGSYCFSNIPGTVQKLLLPGRGAPLPALPADCLGPFDQPYEAVVVLFIDAFGWRFFEQVADKFPFLAHLHTHGVVSALTSQFPSTTSAHVTALNTGLPPSQSGIYEWNQYEPSLDEIINPLPFTRASDRNQRETLVGVGDPSVIYPNRAMYREWRDLGVKTTLFQPRELVKSTYGDTLFAGSETRAFKTLAEGLINLSQALITRQNRHYYTFYYSGFDTVLHQYGPGSPQSEAELELLLIALDRAFLAQVRGKAKSTLLMVIADHGMEEVDSKTAMYLNQTVRGFADWQQRSATGALRMPAGSARDFFLHIRPEALDHAHAALTRHVGERATVRRVDELIAEGYFGPLPASQRFLDRVGNLVVLPHAGQSAWLYERDRYDMSYRGMHGGLSPHEMEIPFIACEL